jgi:nucleotide-binding universal stress UspA family protein
VEAYMYKKILVPLDGSEIAEAALPLIGNLANANGAEIVLLRVAEYPKEMYSVYDLYHPDDPKLSENLQVKKRVYMAAAVEYLESVANSLRQYPCVVTSEVWEGPVVKTINKAAAVLCADLIVISAHGRSTGSLCGIIGSVANQILITSQIPVILANNPQSVAV